MAEELQLPKPNISLASRVRKIPVAGLTIQQLVIAANKLAFMGFEIREAWLEDSGRTLVIAYDRRTGPGLPPEEDPFALVKPV